MKETDDTPRKRNDGFRNAGSRCQGLQFPMCHVPWNRNAGRRFRDLSGLEKSQPKTVRQGGPMEIITTEAVLCPASSIFRRRKKTAVTNYIFDLENEMDVAMGDGHEIGKEANERLSRYTHTGYNRFLRARRVSRH